MTHRVLRRDVLAGMAAIFALPVPPSRASSSTVHEVTITSFRFEPETITVHAGDVIRWINKDLAPHTATAEDFGWDTEEIPTDQAVEIKVKPGMDTDYFCAFHPHMKGHIMLE